MCMLSKYVQCILNQCAYRSEGICKYFSPHNCCYISEFLGTVIILLCRLTVAHASHRYCHFLFCDDV
jgi:hypothetical protein